MIYDGSALEAPSGCFLAPRHREARSWGLWTIRCGGRSVEFILSRLEVHSELHVCLATLKHYVALWNMRFVFKAKWFQCNAVP